MELYLIGGNKTYDSLREDSMKFIIENNISYKPDSLYVYDDEVTFMFKDMEDNLNTGIFDMNKSEIRLIR